MVGLFLDRLGARLMFIVVFAASACSYAILAKATTLAWLYASKIPTVLQAGFLVAQALMVSSTRGDEERASALSKLTTAYTVGATIGPALGGALGAAGDYYLGARLAVAGSVLSALLAVLLPETKASSEMAQRRRDRQLSSFIEIAKRQTVWPLLIVKMLTGVTNSALAAALPLVLRDASFDEKGLGFAMSANAVLVAIVAALGVGPLTRSFGSARKLAFACLAVKLILVAAQTIAVPLAGPLTLAALSAVHGSAAHVMATSLTASTTSAVAADEQGSLLGVEHALFAVARIFGPSLGTAILASTSFSIVAAAAAALDLLTLLFAVHFDYSSSTVARSGIDTPISIAAKKDDVAKDD